MKHYLLLLLFYLLYGIVISYIGTLIIEKDKIPSSDSEFTFENGIKIIINYGKADAVVENTTVKAKSYTLVG